jgi:hypothetical protein
LTSSTKNVIYRVSDLQLEQSLQCWKANSNIYKVIFHKSFLISNFTRSKECPFASHPNDNMLFSVLNVLRTFLLVLEGSIRMGVCLILMGLVEVEFRFYFIF